MSGKERINRAPRNRICLRQYPREIDYIAPFEIMPVCQLVIAPSHDNHRFCKKAQLIDAGQFLRLPDPCNQHIKRTCLQLRKKFDKMALFYRNVGLWRAAFE